MEPDLAIKCAFLAQPGVWPDATHQVRLIDTHLAVVFLTDRHAYKLKRPVRRASLDLSSLAARRMNCEAELRLNRRLASEVYLGLVGLIMTPSGLQVSDPAQEADLIANARVIDWLVKMRRLPAIAMLDERIRRGTLTQRDIQRVGERLARFYSQARPIATSPEAYRHQLLDSLGGTLSALRRPLYQQDAQALRELHDRQHTQLHRLSRHLDERVLRGRIVDGHGDLRPEHICLRSPPVVIDCLEFDARLRAADPADELSGLAIECEFLGAPQVRSWLFQAYCRTRGDRVEGALIALHSVQRALTRARLAAWHLDDPMTETLQHHWRNRAAAFVRLALTHSRSAPV